MASLAYRNKERTRARMRARLASKCPAWRRQWMTMSSLAAELWTVAQSCQVWRRDVEYGAELSSAAQSCLCLPGRCQP